MPGASRHMVAAAKPEDMAALLQTCSEAHIPAIGTESRQNGDGGLAAGYQDKIGDPVQGAAALAGVPSRRCCRNPTPGTKKPRR